MSVEMRSEFEFKIDGGEPRVIKAESWQDALSAFLEHCNASGFSIDARRHKAINEVAKLGRVTL